MGTRAASAYARCVILELSQTGIEHHVTRPSPLLCLLDPPFAAIALVSPESVGSYTSRVVYCLDGVRASSLFARSYLVPPPTLPRRRALTP